MGLLGWFHMSYKDYVRTQTEKANRELHQRFASERALGVTSIYLRRHFLGLGHQGLEGLCHGAKSGAEVRLLRGLLREEPRFAAGIQVLGTDISAEAARASGGDVQEMDFHLLFMDWLGRWDFVYSNTLDHSYHPGSALLSWRATLKGAGGLLVLQRSPNHDTSAMDAVDIYGGSIGDYCALLRAARFEIVDIARLPSTEADIEEDLIFAVRGEAPDVSTVEQVSDKEAAFEVASGKLMPDAGLSSPADGDHDR